MRGDERCFFILYLLWQSLKKYLNAHSFVIIIRGKLIFVRRIEVHKGIKYSMSEMTLVKVQVKIEGHKGQILSQNLDLTYFQHLSFGKL